MFLPALLASTPASAVCLLPPPDHPPAAQPGILAAAPLTPDGRAHVLTADTETVCWWSVDDRGEREVLRVWPLGGPHGVALAASPEGTVLVVLRCGRAWGLLVVTEAGEERWFPIWGGAELVAVRLNARRILLEWCDDSGGRLRSEVDIDDGRMMALTRLGSNGGRGGAQSRQ